MKELEISRRTALKGISAVVATAALSGCSTDSDDDTDNGYINYNPDLKYDHEVRYAFNTGPYDCGGACVHKYHIKNDRVVAMTSAGDTKRVTLNEKDPNNPDEWDAEEKDKPMQYRACVRGYGYMSRNYQPDRLKYPLMQTKKRGDVTGFVRVSWEEACEKIAEKMVDAYKRAPGLGYLPVYGEWQASYTYTNAENMDVAYIYPFSNPSQGNIEAGKLDAIGQDAWRNSRNDRYNAGFIMTWGADPSRQSNWENGAYWVYQKAKEKNIDIVTVAPNCNGNAALYSRTVTTRIPVDSALRTSGTSVEIPGWLGIRPGTDGALMTAMMYVIYRRKLYDYRFLKPGGSEARSCFGFWKGDSVVSVAPPGYITTEGSGGTGNGFPRDIPAENIKQWDDFTGKTFTVPEGYSFEEYLVSLEQKIGSKGWSPIIEKDENTGIEAPAGGGWLKNDPVGAATINDPAKRDNTVAANRGFDLDACDPADYYGVLEYASRITGVDPLIIEALACHYVDNGTGKPSLSDLGCGPQRSYNGAEYIWLGMCLASMCGFADQEGGGFGLSIFCVPDQFSIVAGTARTKDTATPFNHMRPFSYDRKYIVVNGQNLGELIVTGRDGRDIETFKEDAAWTTHGALTDLEKVEIDILYISGGNNFITLPNVNKMRDGILNNLKCMIVVEQVMTPTAAMADFIFPAPTAFEMNSSSVGRVGVTGYHDCRLLAQNVLRHYMFGVQPESYTNACYNYYIYEALKKAGIPGINTTYSKPEPVATTADPDRVFDNMESIKTTVEGYKSSTAYDLATGSPVTGLSYDKLVSDGAVALPIPSKSSVIALQHHRVPGGRGPEGTRAPSTTTGYFNFYSPLWGDERIRKDRLIQKAPADNFTYSSGWRTPVAKYVPVREGYERFFENNNPYERFTGFYSPNRNMYYKLQYITNKAVQRIHTNMGNAAILNDTFQNGVFMNASDAANRGIKDGDMVYVYNDRGCMKVPAKVSGYMAPGVISIEHGAWYKPATDPDETFTVYYEKQMGEEVVEVKNVPVDLGGAPNILTDDMFVYDPIYVRNTATVHGGPCEVSLTKPE